MKREQKVLLIFLGLSLLEMLSEIFYSIYLNSHWVNPLSYKVSFFIIGFIPVLFLIIVIFTYSKNIQYRAYAILLLVSPSTYIMERIYFYFNGKGDTYILLNAIIFCALVFFVFNSIKLYKEHNHRPTFMLLLSVLIIRYVLYSDQVLRYIVNNTNNVISMSYYYVFTTLVVIISGYVIYNASKRTDLNLTSHTD